ncbi:dihydrofolate reductase family protein [Candidatus Poriferisodalis sp.]|uniref:dihydrofolate reductase family protein n=1 Tax=Candidatus Poriferisodalis sp. TaxID=3101277 RepID=UPI003B022726
MHRLFPSPAETVDPHQAASLPRSPHSSRPWVLLNMVASIDGAAALGGLSAGLSGAADKAMFAALRARADVILVGAGTANAERYGRARRSGARIAVVSGSLSVDPELPLFAADAEPATVPLPLIVTTGSADASCAARFEGRAELLRAGDGIVDLRAALAELGARGARVVLCEGGPTLNAGLLACDLVDEINLTHAPLAISAAAPRIVDGLTTGAAKSTPRAFALTQVVTHEGVLFVRWLRARD